MIDNNVDRMSVNILPFSLDRIVRRLEDQSVDKSLQHLLQPDQPGSVGRCSCSFAYGPTRIFLCQFSKSKVQVMKFLISYRTTSDIIGKTKIIRDH